MNVEWDTSEVTALAVDLASAAPKAIVGARVVLQTGAAKIKAEMRKDFSGHRYAPHIPNAVTYETRLGPYGAEAEIGVDKAGPQGGLGNILAFGTSNNAAVVDHTASLRRVAPEVEKALLQVGVEAFGF